MLIGQKSMKASNEITESLHWKLKGIFKALLFFCYSELGGIASFSDYSQSLLNKPWSRIWQPRAPGRGDQEKILEERDLQYMLEIKMMQS